MSIVFTKVMPYVGWLTSCQTIRSSWLIARRSICLLSLSSNVCTDMARFGTRPKYQIEIPAVFSLWRVTVFRWALRCLFSGKKMKWDQRGEVCIKNIILCVARNSFYLSYLMSSTTNVYLNVTYISNLRRKID